MPASPLARPIPSVAAGRPAAFTPPKPFASGAIQRSPAPAVYRPQAVTANTASPRVVGVAGAPGRTAQPAPQGFPRAQASPPALMAAAKMPSPTVRVNPTPPAFRPQVQPMAAAANRAKTPMPFPYAPQRTVQPMRVGGAPPVYNPRAVNNLQLMPMPAFNYGPAGSSYAVQCYGNVIQPGFWDYAGYLSDFLSVSGAVALVVAGFATAAGATGWGWLAPLLYSPLTTLLNAFIEIEAKQQGEENRLKTKTGRLAAYEPAIAAFVTTGLSTVFAVAQFSTSWGGWGWVIAAFTLFVQLALEAVRVRNVDRETLYELIWSKMKACPCMSAGANEQTQLI
jgi:hypothetical protein